jgi:hypothetical protein
VFKFFLGFICAVLWVVGLPFSSQGSHLKRYASYISVRADPHFREGNREPSAPLIRTLLN